MNLFPELSSISQHDKGDWVYDANISYKITDYLTASVISRNLFNHEYMGIPSQVEAPRMWLFQVNLKL